MHAGTDIASIAPRDLRPFDDLNNAGGDLRGASCRGLNAPTDLAGRGSLLLNSGGNVSRARVNLTDHPDNLLDRQDCSGSQYGLARGYEVSGRR